jgi:hypothetical protein
MLRTLAMLALTLPFPAAEMLTAPMGGLPDPLCCTTDFIRQAVFDSGDVPAKDVTLRAEPADLLSLTTTVNDDRHVIVRLRATRPGRGSITFFGPGMTPMATRRVQVISFSTTVSEVIGVEGGFEDGSAVLGGEIIMSPYIRGLDLRFACLGRGVTVPDRMPESWTATETFVRSPSTGNAHMRFRMVRPANGKWVPFTWILYQDGEPINEP